MNLLKGFVKDYFNLIELEEYSRLANLFDEKTRELRSCNLYKKRLQESVETLKEKNNDLVNDIYNLQKDVISLKQEVFPTNPTNVPEKIITYERPVLLGNNQWKKAFIDVRLFINAKDYNILKDLENNELFIENSEDIETKVPKIYRYVKRYYAGKGYSYAYDKQFGFNELWLFEHEARLLRKQNIGLDCEDYAIIIVNYLQAAGLPSNMVFVSAGTTRSGYGHGTVYVKSEGNGWVHLQSTAPYKLKKNLSDYPNKDDEEDKHGVDRFWFSFNKDIAINRFETREAAESFDREQAMKKVKIIEKT